jgi:hypothetical protein
MSRVVDFKRAIYNWEEDDLSLLYRYLQDTFPSLSEDDKKILEEETAKSVLYVQDNKKNKKYTTALLFLQNKEFPAPCVNQPAPAYIPNPDQQAKSVAVPVIESVAVPAPAYIPNPEQQAKSLAVPASESVAVPARAYIPNPDLQDVLGESFAIPAQFTTNTSDHSLLRTLREYNRDHCPDLPDEEVRAHAFDTLSTILKKGLP